jgi:lysophospholipase
LLHGLTEFIEKYGEVASELNERGFTVASLDWRGQGANARALADSRKAHIANFAQFEGDLAAFVETMAPSNARQTRVALAHSMGANISLAQCWSRQCCAYRRGITLIGSPAR